MVRAGNANKPLNDIYIGLARSLTLRSLGVITWNQLRNELDHRGSDIAATAAVQAHNVVSYAFLNVCKPIRTLLIDGFYATRMSIFADYPSQGYSLTAIISLRVDMAS